MKKVLVLFACFILLTSHELFLKSDTYFLNAFEQGELFLLNGTFDISENVITCDRIINPKIIGPDYKHIPVESDYFEIDSVTYFKFKTGQGGTYVAGVSTLPSIIELTGVEFNEYLDHEGLFDVMAEREKSGLTNSPARERYSKHVKAIFQVDKNRSAHFNTNLGYPIEFIPQNNPYDLSVGDHFSLTLFRDGKPLTDQTVHYSSRSLSGNNSIEEESTRTDSNGSFTIKLNKPGLWYVASIHMTESDEKDIDYISNWATLTFEVK